MMDPSFIFLLLKKQRTRIFLVSILFRRGILTIVYSLSIFVIVFLSFRLLTPSSFTYQLRIIQ